ncbi:hypothetical protein BOX15_Mlig021385g1 [Macrostomum lignano]|uniref:RNA helicase n=3 Tax=Macrostomum lignano TaxID=282301 RepID=A0A1I8HLR0_9PLAT|nr:hypothetical protein BOX15_Mlig021385g2 [Macrostomum lignano]PAA61793.1 hypothetical protein BOX15_Mlig021385g1 [Macrostomum lignano]
MSQFAAGDPAFVNQLMRTFVHGETFNPTGLTRISTEPKNFRPQPAVQTDRSQGLDNSPAYAQAVRQVESLGINNYVLTRNIAATSRDGGATASSDGPTAAEYEQQQREQRFQRQQIRPESASISALETLTNITSLRDQTNHTIVEAQPSGLAAPRIVPRSSDLPWDPARYKRLPILQHREDILRSLQCSDIVFIQGNTGCGKSTQVPQYILDNAVDKEQPVNIIVTQPRRIAAVSVSDWICKQRNWAKNARCGYQIGLDNQQSQDTCILYVTTGVLLEKLIHSKRLDYWSHIILDEAHERDLEMDMCLLVIKQLMGASGTGTKLVVMSATMDDAKIRRYLCSDKADDTLDTIRVSEAPYDVETYYYHDAIERVNNSQPMQNDVQLPRLTPQDVDPDDFELNDHKMQLIKRLIASFESGAVLVFLPGLYDIISLSDYLKDPSKCVGIDPHDWEIIPLHSTVSADQQRRAFNNYEFKRKVILATNIAESSITIEDIVYVIDLCQTKYLCKDDNSTLSSLRVGWASKSNLKQRSGRAGRLQSGVCYRLITPEIDAELEEFEPSAMLRCPIENCILKVKLMGEAPLSFLTAAIDPPSPVRIAESVIRLKLVSALSSNVADHFDGELTFLGRVIAHLPVDILVGKLIVLSFIFGCLEDGVIIGACMSSSKSLFSRPIVDFQPDQAIYSFEEKLIYSQGSCSDSVAMCSAFKNFLQNRQSGVFHSDMEVIRWCRTKFIDPRALKEVESLHTDLLRRLEKFNIRPTNSRQGANAKEPQDEVDKILLPIVLAGAFYPNFFIRDTSAYGETGASKEFAGHDPSNTVMFSGFPLNEGDLYRRQLADLVKKYCMHKVLGEPSVSSENSKCFVSFDVEHVMDTEAKSNPDTACGLPSLVGRIHPSVLLALKAGKMAVFRLRYRDANQRSKFMSVLQEFYSKRPDRLAAGAANDGPKSPLACLGSEQNFFVEPTHVVNVGHFYGIPKDFFGMEHEMLNQLQNCTKTRLSSEPFVGLMALAPYQGDYYRCCVLGAPQAGKILVRFIDYGNTGSVLVNELCSMPENLREYPPLAVEIKLAEIKPRGFTHFDGEWTCKESSLFKKILSSRLFSTIHSRTDKLLVHCRIFSIVCDVVRVRVSMIKDKTALIDDEVPTLNMILVQGSACRNMPDWASATLSEILRRIGAPRIQDGFDLSLAESATECYESRRDNSHRRRTFTTSHGKTNSAASTSGGNGSYGRLFDRSELDVLVRNFELTAGAPVFGRGYFTPRGPSHPFEMKFRGLCNSYRRKQIGLDADSVNSVAIDPEPQNPTDRLLIAGSVMLDSKNQNRLVLSHTTLFPHIPGLPALLCLLFAPQMEPRCNPHGLTHYTGFLCGMGAIDGQPVDPAHDLLVQPDVLLDNSDLVRVNQIRMQANFMLGDRGGSSSLQLVECDLVNLRNRQNMLRSLLRQLFFKTAYPLVPKTLETAGPNADYWGWPRRLGVTMGTPTNQIANCSMYSLHNAIQDIGANKGRLLATSAGGQLLPDNGANANYNKSGWDAWVLRWRQFLNDQLQCLNRAVQSRRDDGWAFVCPVCYDSCGNAGLFLHDLKELEDHLGSNEHAENVAYWRL